MSNLNSKMIHDKGYSLQAVGISNPSPVEPSIDDDDGVDFDDDEAEDDKETGRKRSLRRGGKGNLMSLQLVDVQDNAIVASNGVQNIVSTARVEAVQINVTCLILPALEGVDSALEQMNRMIRRVKLRA